MNWRQWWTYWRCITGRDTPYSIESEDGRYHLLVYPKSNGKGRWNYLRIFVFKRRGLWPMAYTSRNYSHIGPVQFLMNYQTGHDRDFLLISENYHGGHGVIDLRTGKKYSYDPRHDPKLAEDDKGVQWCWASLERVNGAPAPHKAQPSALEQHFTFHANVPPEDYFKPAGPKTITVAGCFWGMGYDWDTFDFSDPYTLPYKRIGSEDEPVCQTCYETLPNHPAIPHDCEDDA